MMSFFDRLRRGADRDPMSDPTSLGRLLLDNGLVTESELSEALRDKDRLIGRALINSGAVDVGVIEAMLVVQRARRNEMSTKEVVEFARESIKKTNTMHQLLQATLTSKAG